MKTKEIIADYVNHFHNARQTRRRLAGVLLLLALAVSAGVFWRLHYTGVALANSTECGLTEHEHGEDCYTMELICELEETDGVEGHTHDETCYETETVLTCGLEESDDIQAVEGHTHDDSCYREESVLICEVTEGEDHTHTEACYETETVLICGLEESEGTPAVEGHTHSESCYETETVLTCGLEESEAVPGHTHTDDCYEKVLTCDLEEHVHTVACMSNDAADVETASDWEATLPDNLSGVWAEDVVAIAKSQLGYTESTENYMVDEDGNKKGYTRYGAWYGNAYGDWCAMFASFCLHYAGVPEEEFPEQAGCYAWTEALKEMNRYAEAEEYTPVSGDLVFFDRTGDGRANHVGIVEEAETETDPDTGEVRLVTLTTIEGNSSNRVKENTYDPDDSKILGYGILPEQPEEDAAEADPVDLYSITYTGEHPEVMEIEGPDTVAEGDDLVFCVTVSDGYAIAEATANEEELLPAEVTESAEGEGTVYSYQLQGISGDTVVSLNAEQVLKGSGSIKAYEIDSTHEDPEYTLTVTDAPTNTRISLNSTTITVTDQNDNEVSVTLEGNLWYAFDGTTSITDATVVAYLMLDDNVKAEGWTEDNPVYEEGVFVLTPYDEDGNALSGGKLILNILGTDRVQIWNIQTNTLCSLDGQGRYQQEIIGAVPAFEALTYVVDDMTEGREVDLAELTETKTDHPEYKFYYGSIDAGNIQLTLCTTGKIVNDRLLPLDGSGNAVEDYGALYMAYDELYSFDVEVTNVVNEHTEDNGDTYLWFGDEFYIDQYHSQGYNDLKSYTLNGSSAYWSGVWAQLGRRREIVVNDGTKTLDDYKDVKYEDLDAEGFEISTNITLSEEELKSHTYGIVGPYSFADTGESEPETSTVRVTGRVGDEFISSEVFGSDTVYMVQTGTPLETDWINLGSHASDNGQRAWFYWIRDYYVVNNYQDVLEYVEIKEENGQVRLHADEIGEGTGADYDVWEVDLYTKRNSEIKQWMLDNKEELESLGVGFAEYAGGSNHIQLRVGTTIETVVNGIVYSGKLDVLYDESGYGVPSASAVIHCTGADGEAIDLEEADHIFDKDNEQETKSWYFADKRYISFEDLYDSSKVQFTVTVGATGTLTGTDGSTIVYTQSSPLLYTVTLTDELLMEAYDCCPNGEGYDVAINLSDAVKLNSERQIILYKVWDDNNNYSGVRDNVNHVTVSLERSKGGESEDRNDWEWEDVADDFGQKRAFAIWGSPSENVWSEVLTAADLDLTYTDEQGSEQDWHFRISLEQDIDGVEGGYGYGLQYVYNIEDNVLVIRNTLNEYPISISGRKEWIDADGEKMDESKMPDSVTIALYQNGDFYAMTEVSAATDWAFSFTDVPQTLLSPDGDLKYDYTLCELTPDGTVAEAGQTVLLEKGFYQVTIRSSGDAEDPEEEGGESGNDGDDDSYFDDDFDYVITNTFVDTEELPVTGGIGTKPYTAAGLLILALAACLLYRDRKRWRKEDSLAGDRKASR